MGRNGRIKENKSKQIAQVSYPFSKEEQIEIQADAYYKALKKIESEKETKPITQEKRSWTEMVLLLINMFFWPFHLSKKLSAEKMPDVLLGTLIISVLGIIGLIVWISGILLMIGAIFMAIVVPLLVSVR